LIEVPHGGELRGRRLAAGQKTGRRRRNLASAGKKKISGGERGQNRHNTTEEGKNLETNRTVRKAYS